MSLFFLNPHHLSCIPVGGRDTDGRIPVGGRDTDGRTRLKLRPRKNVSAIIYNKLFIPEKSRHPLAQVEGT